MRVVFFSAEMVIEYFYSSSSVSVNVISVFFYTISYLFVCISQCRCFRVVYNRCLCPRFCVVSQCFWAVFRKKKSVSKKKKKMLMYVIVDSVSIGYLEKMIIRTILKWIIRVFYYISSSVLYFCLGMSVIRSMYSISVSALVSVKFRNVFGQFFEKRAKNDVCGCGFGIYLGKMAIKMNLK